MSEGFRKEFIKLPAGTLKSGNHFALDIGGSLAKVVYYCSCSNSEMVEKCRLEDKLYMVSYTTDKLDDCLVFIQNQMQGTITRKHDVVKVTGVGCMKHKKEIEKKLEVSLDLDSSEMTEAVRGLEFLWSYLPQEKLLHQNPGPPDLNYKCPITESGLLPCLLVNLGSAMTIVKVDENGHCQGIVGGSTRGGLTFLGMGALLTKAKSFKELVALAEKGDHRNVDILLKDTAGETYNNLPSDTMVSSFGKAASLLEKDNRENVFREEDIANSILRQLTSDLAETVVLIAKVHNISKVCFCGSFISDNQIVMRLLDEVVKASAPWLQMNLQTLFLRHEAYLGAIGSLVSGISKNGV